MWIDTIQNSQDWFNLRMDKVTSSNFAKIMAHENKGKFGDPAERYAKEIAANIVTGKIEEKDSYNSQFMKDGHEYEPVAIRHYERDKFCATTNGGFFYSEDGRFGDSPDFNVGINNEGCGEVKCVIRTTQIDRIDAGGYDTAYRWQYQGHIWLGEKKYCDFVQFCHSMPDNAKLYVYRIHRDEDMIKRLETRLNEFWLLVEKNVKLINDYKL
jgi:hypothetical protein